MADLDIKLMPDGDVSVPTNPHAARLRLAQMESDPAVIEALLDPAHPMHEYRTVERRGLQIFAARKA